MLKRFISGWFAEADGEPRMLLRADFALAAAVFIVAIIFAVIAGRGQSGYTGLSFRYAAQALGIASGNGWGAYYEWPPGYPLLIAALIKGGFSSLRAVWALSILSYAIGAAASYLLCRRLFDRRLGALAVLLFCVSPVSLKSANWAMSEMPFFASTLLAMLAMDWFLWSSSKKKTWAAAVLVGVITAGTFWIRNVGIVNVAIALVLLAIYFWRHPARRNGILLVMVVIATLASAIFVRNLIGTGTLSGHDLGAKPVDTFLPTFVNMLWYVGVSLVPLPGGLLESIPKLAMVTGTAIFITVLAIALIGKARQFMIAVYPLCYLLFFAWSASHTRLDIINSDRYIVPALPPLWLSLVLLWPHCAAYAPPRCMMGVSRLIRLGLISVMSVSIAHGGVLVVKGVSLNNFNYSPATLAFICSHIVVGTSIVVNRYGDQLPATSVNYPTMILPLDDVDNGSLPRAYGVHPWSRKEALKYFVEADVRCVVFFTGVGQQEPYLKAHSYGAYISQLFMQQVPEVKGLEKLPDGVIYYLVDRPQLAALLADLEYGKVLPRPDVPAKSL